MMAFCTSYASLTHFFISFTLFEVAHPLTMKDTDNKVKLIHDQTDKTPADFIEFKLNTLFLIDFPSFPPKSNHKKKPCQEKNLFYIIISIRYIEFKLKLIGL
jgi:hypothetical protein